MNIGGNAFGSSVTFRSPNYSMTCKVSKDGTYILEHKDRRISNSRHRFLGRIPFVKGIYSLMTGHFLIWFSFMIFLSMEAALLFSGGEENISPVIMYTLLGLSAAVLLYIAVKIIINIEDTWKFHGAEHKTIYAIENNIELIMENVRKCPRVAKRCGTNFVMLFYFSILFSVQYLLHQV